MLNCGKVRQLAAVNFLFARLAFTSVGTHGIEYLSQNRFRLRHLSRAYKLVGWHECLVGTRKYSEAKRTGTDGCRLFGDHAKVVGRGKTVGSLGLLKHFLQ